MKNIRVFLCGDVMTGRGIDQILPHPNKPQLYESYVTDAREYVSLAEAVNGKIHYPVAMNYIWGEALTVWKQLKPDVKIINLETAITESDDYLPHKGIHYRMHPLNVDTLTSANIDICTLANNHLLDWGDKGLKETITTLKNAGIQFAGVGENSKQAMQPAIFELSLNKRVLVFSAGLASSGIPPTWRATSKCPGIYYLPDINHDVVASIAEHIKNYKQRDDLILFSIHWGSNWGYEIPASFRSFAHGLIDIAKVDVIFGHSSHHPRSIEVYKDKPILYGCGDFINDYEGISGYEKYRGDLTLMYFLDFDSETLKFEKMTLVPLQIKKLRLHRASNEDSKWLLQTLNQSSTFSVPLTLQDQHFIYINHSAGNKF
jgi:poly-gamma-glutamate capsule biosynthesis protein CapA/YwtB (metallophosphatase superfamily)